jgi:N4-gp56 family major capsid protein
MGLGTNQVIKTDVPNFIPQLWSDEVIASYKANLTMANLVRKLNHRGKKGDTIKIPTPTRAGTSNKTANTQVTLIAHGTDAGLTVTINKHKEYSRLIEDIVDVQALGSLRRFYTDDAGYAIAKRIDRDLILEAAAFGTGPSGSGNTIVEDASTGNIDTTSTFTNAFIGDGATAWSAAANANAGNATDLSDLGIRRLIKKLDDVDAPLSGRYLVIPPVIKADLLGLARFSEQAFTGEVGRGNTIRNGLVGDIYGVEVYITNQLQKVEDGGSAIDQDLALFFQRDALLLVEQMGVRTQQQYKQEYLGDLFTADMIYGVKGLRSTSILPIVVPSVFTDG